jgi:DNA-binding transcriptional LysR family regulator
VEISQLRAILVLRDTASLTAAGKQLGLSASAVFCQIRQLEEEIGAKLYEQVGKKLRLTDRGDLLSRYASRIVEMHDRTVLGSQENIATREHISIGCGPLSSVRIVPHLLRALRSEFPTLTARIVTSGDQELVRDLRSGVLDVIMMSVPLGEVSLQEEPLWSYNLVAVKPSPTVSDEVNENSDGSLPLILFRRPGVIDLAVNSFLMRMDAEPNILIENDNPASIREIVKLGLGAAMLPDWSIVEERKAGEVLVDPAHAGPKYNYGVIYQRSEYRSHALDMFLLVCRKWQKWWPYAAEVGAPEFGSPE